MTEKIPTPYTILSFLFLIITFFWLQSIYSPFAFIQEGVYLLQPYDVKGALKGGIFFGAYLFAILAILVAILAKNSLLAVIFIVFISVTYGIDMFVQLVGSNKNGLSFEIFSLGMLEISRAMDVLLFKTPLVQASAIAVLLFLVLFLARKYMFKPIRVKTSYSVASFFMAVVLVLGVTLKIFSIVGQSFPAPIKTLSIAVEFFLENNNQEKRILSSSVNPIVKPEYKTIVWVIDESVGGQYLSVNGYEQDTTPYLKSLGSSHDFINYGVVPSISNCSATSNLFLRIGLTTKPSFSQNIQTFRDSMRKLPTIFQYAKRAGYQTYLIDAQAAEGQLQDRLSLDDTTYIDQFVTFSRRFIPNVRDQQALKVINNVLENEQEKLNFVVVVKWGAHWPYNLTYPVDKEYFKPATRESYTEMKEENKKLILNAYQNSIRYTVDSFLKQLTYKGIDSDQIVFYTSDHGQSLFYNNDPLTHCHSEDDLPKDEFKVPLMVFSKNVRDKLWINSASRVSQEQIFPTTLKMMGYSDKLYLSYGDPLDENNNIATRKSYILDTGKLVDFEETVN